MLTFHSLSVCELRPEGDDAVCIAFGTPEHLRNAYRFLPGQHVGVRARIGGEEVRRTYSVCSGADDRYLRIGVRLHERGVMSRYLATQLRVGDTLDVLTPTGRFFVEPDPGAASTWCAFAAGSGITPILGILKNVLPHQPLSRCLLFYGNRTTASIMFAEDLLALKDRYPQRLSLSFILSREPQDVDLLNGRLDEEKILQLGRTLFDPGGVDAYFLCGPGTMIESVRASLRQLGVEAQRIHTERFASDALRAAASGAAAQDIDELRGVGEGEAKRAPAAPLPLAKQMTQVTVVMDGRRRSFSMASGAGTVLEAAERAGLELPFSCRAGVCSTCRARVIRGSVTMTTNYALEPMEVAAGYVLCCQALPASAELELSYDER